MLIYPAVLHTYGRVGPFDLVFLLRLDETLKKIFCAFSREFARHFRYNIVTLAGAASYTERC